MFKHYGMTATLLAIAFGGGFLVGHGAPVAAQAKNRVFEIRTYTMNDGRLDTLVKRLRQGEARLFDKVGMQGVGFFVAAEPPKSENTFVYILAHESRERAKESWAKFTNDPEWQTLRQTAESPGPIKVESIFVSPVDFSPLK